MNKSEKNRFVFSNNPIFIFRNIINFFSNQTPHMICNLEISTFKRKTKCIRNKKLNQLGIIKKKNKTKFNMFP